MRMRNAGCGALALLVLTWLGAPASPALGASRDGIWTDVDEALLAPLASNRQIFPARYRTVAVDLAALQGLLVRAPLEGSTPLLQSQVVLSLPMPDGKFQRFRIENSPVMEPALALRHQEIMTFRGQGIDDPTAATRFGWTTAGFHAIVRSREGMSYIDRYAKGDVLHYISYYKRDYLTDKRMQCLFESGSERTGTMEVSAVDFNNGGTRRTYRLALAANFEYSDFHSDALPPSKTDVLNNGIVPTINRVNFVYEQDFAVHMNLVANEEDIIFNTPADPYVNEDGTSMLVANQATLDAIIGQANYDIGHVFSTGGGGVAFLGVVCDASVPVQKAGGVTGNPAPVSDTFDIDYVAHEMGHQYGGNHTFNGNTGSCSGGNRSAAHAYEVGSGSTIQAYAGICGAQNLQPHSDAYFHNESYREMGTFIFSGAGNTCDVSVGTGNTPPSIDAGPISGPNPGSLAASFTIPARTPFALTAVGADADGDTLTYNWEEYDLGPANDGNTDNGTSPILRSFDSTVSPTRTFPKLSDLLNNVSSYGEKLPTTTRDLKFCVTARDNRSGAGGVEFDCLKLRVDSGAGPFKVSEPDDGAEVWTGGQSQTVAWNVANTTAVPVSTANVNIRLSVDGGLTYPFTLAAGVPNDGSETVTAPNSPSSQARVKVEGAGNVFFDISDKDFRIVAGSEPPDAVDDVASTAFNTPAVVAVLANDSDPNGDTIAITAVQSPTPAGGTAVIDDNGTPGTTADDRILYTPASGFTGDDTFNYTITAGGDSDTALVTVTVFAGCPPVPTGAFTEDVESPDPGWSFDLAANTAGNAPVTWGARADPTAHSPTNSFSSDATCAGGIKDDRLVSPPMDASSTTRLIFWHRFFFESGFDGGLLEVSVNGGAWQDLIGAGGSFVVGGYNGVVNAGFQSPIAGRPAWTTSTPPPPSAMTRVEVNLAAFGGSTVKVRWRLGCDNGFLTTGTGWFVDDIQFTDLLEETEDCPLPPTALDDAAVTDEDVPVTIDVLANDSDPNGDSLMVTEVTAPSKGTATNNGNGTVTYTPNPDFFGVDTFRYTVCDPGPLCATADVSVDVQSVNDQPFAVEDSAATTSGTPVAINVLSNDSDIDGDMLTVTSVSDPPHGTAVRNANDTVTYTSDNDFVGEDSFTYTIGDGRGGTDTATVRVTVTAPSRADLRISLITVNNNKSVREGDKVTIRATVRNDGNAAATASQTEFVLDGSRVLGLVSTPMVNAGSEAVVSVQWDTRSTKGPHTVTVTADKGGVIVESNEGNNSSSVTVTVQGNKTKNPSFEQSSSQPSGGAGTMSAKSSSSSGPAYWTGSSTGAGTATWSDGGSDGAKSAGATGNGGNAATRGSPSWTSDPITVTPGEALALLVSVSSTNASSEPTAGLVYLGAAGNVLQTVNLITAPLTTAGFAKLEQTVTIPPGVAQVRVKLVGFAPTDLRTVGTVKFDEVGLYGN